MEYSNKTRITFHRGSAFAAEGITPEPFATFLINDLVNAELIEGLCALVREHVHTLHADFCNIKLTTEDWDT
jgi:hypothetical protein